MGLPGQPRLMVMDFLQRLFLESPIFLGFFSFIVLAVALFARRRYIDSFGPWLVPGALGLFAALFAVQYFVVTDREEILGALENFVAAIEANSPARIDGAISAQYESEGMGKDEILGFIHGTLARMKIYDTRFHRRDVTMQADHGEMILAARATVSIDGGVGGMHWGSWRIDWVREDGVWRISAIRPTMIDGQEIRGMRGLRGVVP
jgi:hypothetical protein